jgi:hypothetical protein
LPAGKLLIMLTGSWPLQKANESLANPSKQEERDTGMIDR